VRTRGGPLAVVHLATNRWWTGSADPALRLVSGLRARGHDVRLAMTPGDRFEARAREAGVPLVDGLRLQPRLAPVALARDLARLRALVRAAAVAILHTHHSHDHWLAVLAARGLRGSAPRVVRTFHNAGAVKRDPLARGLYRRTHAAFVVSAGVEARAVEAGIPSARVHRVPGVADLARFTGREDGAAMRAALGLGDAPVVVSVARMVPGRGHDLLLRGFARLRERLPAARLLLVGKGPAREGLERLTAQLALAASVTFTGYRDQDLPDVLAAGDCFALMAAGSDESCRAALEAMAAARPVVARRVGALPETVVHGETGLLVDDDRPESVAAALAAVLQAPGRARAMGAAGRRRAETAFAPERAVDVVEAVYRAIAEAP
jgi:glycosyltransferase involved in cell wall biosynthesis